MNTMSIWQNTSSPVSVNRHTSFIDEITDEDFEHQLSNSFCVNFHTGILYFIQATDGVGFRLAQYDNPEICIVVSKEELIEHFDTQLPPPSYVTIKTPTSEELCYVSHTEQRTNKQLLTPHGVKITACTPVVSHTPKIISKWYKPQQYERRAKVLIMHRTGILTPDFALCEYLPLFRASQITKTKAWEKYIYNLLEGVAWDKEMLLSLLTWNNQ